MFCPPVIRLAVSVPARLGRVIALLVDVVIVERAARAQGAGSACVSENAFTAGACERNVSIR